MLKIKAVKPTKKFEKLFSDLKTVVRKRTKTAVEDFSMGIHASVQSEMKFGVNSFKDSERDRPGDVPAAVRPHLREWLSDTKNMVADAVESKSVTFGGWGKLKHMDALIPTWQAHGPTDAEGNATPFGPPRTNDRRPLWRIVTEGRGYGVTVMPRFPSYTGRTDWLMWTEKGGGRIHRRFYKAKTHGPLHIGPMHPRPFIDTALHNLAANMGNGRMEFLEDFFAQFVAERLGRNLWKVAKPAVFKRRRGK